LDSGKIYDWFSNWKLWWIEQPNGFIEKRTFIVNKKMLNYLITKIFFLNKNKNYLSDFNDIYYYIGDYKFKTEKDIYKQ